MNTDASVMPTPTAKAQPIVRGRRTVEEAGKPAPAELKIAISSFATPMPPAIPAIVAITDITSASKKMSRMTCPPFAPTARIMASSRSRWPIVIWNTL